MIKRRVAIPPSPSLEDVEQVARESGLSKELVLIRDITKDMFSGQVSEEVDYDPDEPSDCFILFSVNASGDIESLVDKQLEWHRQVAAAAPISSSFFRISINTVQ